MKASVMLIVLMTFFVGVVAQGQLERFGMWVYDWNNQNLFNRNHGNVGINTQNPTEALDVMGNVKVDGGVILNTNKQRPACTNANRGELWLEKGTIDTFNVCLKADLLEVSQMVNQDERTTECTGNPNGNVFYCFGGNALSGPGHQSSILELDVQAQTVTTVSPTLPSVRFSHSCVYHNQDQNIYCFGGQNSGYLDEIIKFDTVTKTVSIQNAVLPTTNRHHSCASHPNGNIYCFGGGQQRAYV